ncbi:MAG TPA: hypothetical protein VLT62_17670 [Candidatus Methylomirabilis sp.]|nr:hypothetical protein [Candidatus Methylomirabilis sp.]
MALRQWQDNGWLRPHITSREEIGNLLTIVKRDLQDAQGGISPDWRFGIAYNAALKLCTILLFSEGYRPERTLQHYRTIQCLPIILGQERRADADYLEVCRSKRNRVEYDYVGGVSDDDVHELLEFVTGLRGQVLTWLKARHPELLPPSI